MTCEIYDIGDRPTLKATFYDDSNPRVLANPVAITFKLKAPDDTVTTETEIAATNPSVGVWLWPSPVTLNAPGTWKMQATATGGLTTAGVIEFKVRKSDF